MKIRFFRIIACSFLLATFLIPLDNVLADEYSVVEIPLQAFHDEQPIQLRGLYSSQTLNIPIPASWIISGEDWMEISVRASELLDLERASLTISLNGLQVVSVPLSKVAGTTQKILIPANMFSQGNNELTFSGMLYLSADRDTNCQNWDDPSRWLVIDAGGLLHLSFAKRELPIDLSFFPQTFIEPLEKYLPEANQTKILFVLPDDKTQDDLTSLVTTSYVLGREAVDRFNWTPEIVNESQFEAGNAANKNIIFIGKIPALLESSVTAANQNFIALLPSPWGAGNVILIIGDKNREDGFSPAVVFNDPTRRVLLRGNIAYIEDDYISSKPPAFQEKATFEDLGYSDRTVRGIGEQDLTYRLYIPYNVDPVTATMKLSMVHTPDLDSQASSIGVYLNGFSVAGILPTARSANPAPIEIDLPADRLRPGINFIRITFDLHLPYTSCERAPQSVWATILSSSAIALTYQNRTPVPSLKYFPLPFSDCPGSTYIIPDNYASKELVDISRLSFTLGQSAQMVSCSPKVLTASNSNTETIGHTNLIMVGLPVDNAAIMRVNNLLPQPFTADGSAIQEGYGVLLPTSDQTASVGLMQIILSPQDNKNVILILTGNDNQGLAWTWDLLLDPAVQDQFSGNIMVVGSGKRSNSLTSPQTDNVQVDFQQTPDVSNIPIIGPLLQKSGNFFLATALIAVGVALIIAMIALLISQIVKRKNGQ